MSSKDRSATAILGTGRIAPVHVAAVRATGLSDVVAVAGSDVERTRRVAREWDVPRAITVPEAIDDGSIGVVHVVGTNDVHADVALRAINAGKHVVVEKPIALTTRDAQAIVDAAAAQGRQGMTTFTYRGFPAVRAMRASISRDAIGTPHLIHGSYLQDWLASDAAYDWRCDPILGGASRALADIGTHWFALVEFVTRARVESVVADFGQAFARRADANDGGDRKAVANEDTASVLFRLSNGARGAFVASQVSHGHGNHIGLEVTGPGGTLAWEIEDPDLVRHQRSAQDAGERAIDAHATRIRSIDIVDAFGALVDAFYRDLAGIPPRGSAPYPTLTDGARAVAIVEAALRSAESATWQPVAEIRPVPATSATPGT